MHDDYRASLITKTYHRGARALFFSLITLEKKKLPPFMVAAFLLIVGSFGFFSCAHEMPEPETAAAAFFLLSSSGLLHAAWNYGEREFFTQLSVSLTV